VYFGVGSRFKLDAGFNSYEKSSSVFYFSLSSAAMNAPDTTQLVDLKVGDCFQFAQHRSRRMTDEHVPQWKVVHAGTEFYEVMLDNISPISSGPAGRSTRLASTTLVRRVAGV
jgi:hypothetical protein